MPIRKTRLWSIRTGLHFDSTICEHREIQKKRQFFKGFKRRMKYRFVILFCVLLSMQGFAQASECAFKIDSTRVFRKAKLRGIYWTKDWICPPKIKLDTLACTWVFTSCKTRYSNWGDCKNTNGCTIWFSAQMLVDARTGKVVSCTREKTRSHNYE